MPKFINAGQFKPTHGETIGGKRTPEYNTWLSMHVRCYNNSAKRFKHYGGRGIKVCERWHSFENFLTDMGRRPGGKREYSIERIDVDGHYEPSNCIWLPLIEQNKNRRRREPWKDIGISRGYYYRKYGNLGPK